MRRFVILALLLCAGCSQSQRQTLVCEHCTCGDRDLTHPVGCELLGMEQWVHCCAMDGS